MQICIIARGAQEGSHCALFAFSPSLLGRGGLVRPSRFGRCVMAKQSGGWKGQRGTRQERGYGAAWDRLRLVILRRDCYLCQPCKAKDRATAATAVDHIKPKAQGGTDDPENLQSICDDCHRAKSAAEGHGARGHRERLTFDDNGWPDWPDD